MKFKFRLESVMRHRKVERDLAEREHAEALNNLNRKLGAIKQMYVDIDEARVKASNVTSAGGQGWGELVQVEEFIVGQKVRIERARMEARDLMTIVEEKHELLVSAAQRMKVLEKLKEKKLAEFKTASKKHELAQLEDIIILRHGKEGVTDEKEQ
jgi:flagellar FliJ protein